MKKLLILFTFIIPSFVYAQMMMGVYSASARQYNFYINSQTGNDANSGTTPQSPVKSIAQLQALMQAYGNGATALFIDKGGYYHEDLNLFGYRAVFVNGNYATLDASDTIKGVWVQADNVTYPNVWSYFVTTQDSLGQVGLMTINNQLPRLATSLSQCNSTPSSYFIWPNALTGTTPLKDTFTLYIYSTTNPNTNGNIYAVMQRNRGFYLDNSSTFVNVTTKTAVTNNGSAEYLDTCEAHNNLYAFGAKHNTYMQSGTFYDCVSFGADGFPNPDQYVYYNVKNVTSDSPVMKRCIGTDSVYRSWLTTYSSVFGHGNPTVAFNAFTIDGCLFKNLQSVGAPSCSTYYVYNTYGNVVGGISGSSSSINVYCNNFTMNQLNVGGNLNTIIASSKGSSYFTNVSAYEDSIVSGGSSVIAIGSYSTFSLINSTIAGGTRSGMQNTQTSGNLIFNYNILTYNPQFSATIICPTGQTYTGNHNIFYRRNGVQQVALSYHGTTYTTLTSWQSATGQDANSVYVTTAQLANLYLGNPANGDFRINPQAQVTAANGTVYTGTFPDGTPITLAGVQTHYDFNKKQSIAGAPTYWPNVPATYNDCYNYIQSPATWSF